MIPLNLLPGWLRAVSMILPTTHVAIAMRAALLGQISPTLWISFAVLAFYAIGSVVLVVPKLDWRT